MIESYPVPDKHNTIRPFRWLRIFLRLIIGAAFTLILLYLGVAWYVHTHKKEVLASITSQLNTSLTGTLAINNMEPALLEDFPHISVRLDGVTLKDSLYNNHKHTLLTAGNAYTSVYLWALLTGDVKIKQITVEHAKVDLFTDADGYSNTTIFKHKRHEGTSANSGSLPALKKILFKDVKFIAEDLQKNKLHNFVVKSLSADLKNLKNGWRSEIKLDAFAKSMAFNREKGSFIKNKPLSGKLNISFNKNSNVLQLNKSRLKIDNEDFVVNGTFNTGTSSLFNVSIKSEDILWYNAAAMLADNIKQKLNKFNFKDPIAVSCKISGDLKKRGNPYIKILAKVNNNTLETPGGTIDNCSFTGVFSNENNKGEGYNDENSVILLNGFKGSYADIPFRMRKAMISNLKEPIVTGNFESNFKVQKLKALVDDDLLKFGKGIADVKVNFKDDIQHFEIARPLVNGTINVKGADIAYVPRNLNFKDVSVELHFSDNNLNINNVVLKSGKSIINMKGRIKNFLNLYYAAPEKVLLQWDVNCPQLHLAEFISFLDKRKTNKSQKQAKSRKGNFTKEIDGLFDKSNVAMKLKVDKLYYKNFYATGASADIELIQNKITVNHLGLNHSGGRLKVNGALQQGKQSRYWLNADINKVNVSEFFSAFDNFGLDALTAKNLQGLFSSKASIVGRLDKSGALVPNSIMGKVNFSLHEGRLINFEPVHSIGKFAFPFRDTKDIKFYNLKGDFDIRGDKVFIAPMQISSSVLNLDFEGLYCFDKGTKIYIDVPLRNSKKDNGIKDKDKRAEKRYNGIVLHLTAMDDEDDGKVKIKLGHKD